MSGPKSNQAAGARGRRQSRALLLALGLVVFVIAVFLAGVGVAAALSHATNATTWNTWGNVGQTFESVNAVFSGLAFAALIVTFWIQLKELREQRLELQLQREAALSSRDELWRGTEVDLRRLHVQLVKMSIDDPVLASVWPPVAPGLSADVTKQYNYANLVLQHCRMSLELGYYSEDATRAVLAYLLSSQTVRDYWSSSRAARLAATVDVRELRFVSLVEEIHQQLAELAAD
ncbi:MAG: hypothetical protein V7603_4383 [Micromonosporaceae bacterium]